MEISKLTDMAKAFLRENYNLQLEIPIVRNNRLRTTQGRYVMKRNQIPVRIDIAGQTLDYGTDEAILGILKHECIHYALHRLGKPYKDGTALFEAELKKHQAPSTGGKFIGKVYLFTCDQCGETGETNRKQLTKTPEKYRTTCCQTTLTWIGEKIYDGSSLV